MSTDRIGRHEILIPINRNFNKICDLPAVKERPFKRARDGAYVLLNCPIKAEIRAVDIANQI